MNFIFICPEKNSVFETDDFKIVDNNGVRIDPAGNKFLDAKVALGQPCPHCGGLHEFPVSELACPFVLKE